jgi:hypothetical protein
LSGLEEAVAVATYANRAAEKLRGQGLAVNRIMVFAHTKSLQAGGTAIYGAAAGQFADRYGG